MRIYIFIINSIVFSIIKAGKSFNNHLSKLINALKARKNNIVQYEVSDFTNDPCLNVCFDDNSNITSSLSPWYCVKSQMNSDYIETPTEIENQGEFFITKKNFLNDTI